MMDHAATGPWLIAAWLLAAGLSLWLTRAICAGDLRLLHIADHPNERSLHTTPVPRTGGIALAAGILGGWLLCTLGFGADAWLGWIALAAMLVAGVSFLDDWRDVPRRLRLAAHLGAAALLCAGGFVWDQSWLPGGSGALPAAVAWLLTLLFVAWMINLYNFMDGMDGFAGGMAVFGFGALGVLGWQGGDPLFAAISGSVVAAALGFLSGNFPPARIFLGDVGSSLLGLLAAALSLWGARAGLFPLWIGLLVFSPFIVDATWTLARRAWNAERVWEAHRTHHYQRLVLAGWGHRKTVLRAYLLMGAVAASAVPAVRMPVREQWMLILAWVVVYALIHMRVGLAERLAGTGRQ